MHTFTKIISVNQAQALNYFHRAQLNLCSLIITFLLVDFAMCRVVAHIFQIKTCIFHDIKHHKQASGQA